jgi:phosphohistidine phosphatase
MFELMLMRHAKSDWHSHTADIDRPLNGRGSRDAVRMGAYLKQHDLVPDKLIVSAAQRTRQTAALLLENLPATEEHIIVDRELYLSDAETMCELIEAYATENQRLLLLAHNPGMDDLVSYLASAAPPLSDNGKLMTTCAVACFRLDSLEALERPGRADLLHLLRPKEILAADTWGSD